jgi:hypothetical protein
MADSEYITRDMGKGEVRLFPTGNGTYLEDPLIAAAFRGDIVRKQVDNLSVLSSDGGPVTSSDCCYDLAEDETIMITSFSFGIPTLKDFASAKLVSYDQAGATGNETVHSPSIVKNSAGAAGNETTTHRFIPPLKIAWEDGHRSITININSIGDTDMLFDLGWQGWRAAKKWA